MKESPVYKLTTGMVLGAGILLILFPCYFVTVSAFKNNAQIITNFFAPPSSLFLDNFIAIIKKQGFFRYFYNSIWITVIGLLGGFLILPMTSYPIARMMGKSRFYRYLYYFLLIGIFVPFQVKMMPLIKLTSMMGMMNKLGLVIVYYAGSICEGVFLYVGYISSLSASIEEAAYIDGASPFQTYWRIVLPQLAPMTATIMISNGLWFWNDFTLPLLMLNTRPKEWTLVLFQYNFKSKYYIDYSMVFASLFISCIPIIIFYIFMQKHIISGLSGGAVKE
ncbi:MAG: carbohydrate ABC transporter permease [Treponema sp.]|jgi:raffinose/stachyose/melibiose transport system permease protein|nr:carbohydrate ABC transporter permease [Treponema sp.]